MKSYQVSNLDIIWLNLNELFPEFINRNLKEGLQLMNQKMPGFIDEATILTGVEARSSAACKNRS